MNLYDFKVTKINGQPFDFKEMEGKKVMIVNTASKCGLTPQYDQLQTVFEQEDTSRFTIIGFPANDFGQQEPGTNEEITTFCTKNYGITFPMMSKIAVKGANIHPLYAWLLAESKKKGEHDEVQWNFHKFLIDEKGDFVKSIHPKVLPNDKEILDWIHD